MRWCLWQAAVCMASQERASCHRASKSRGAAQDGSRSISNFAEIRQQVPGTDCTTASGAGWRRQQDAAADASFAADGQAGHGPHIVQDDERGDHTRDGEVGELEGRAGRHVCNPVPGLDSLGYAPPPLAKLPIQL